METNTIILIAIGASAFLIFIALVKTYNGFIKTRNRVKTQWAQIDVQLKRRAELIPNLIESVKGYVKHENDVIDRVVAARSKMVGAGNPKEAAQANAELTSALGRVFALGEAYPDLKADRNFVQLQDSLVETESKIAYARQFYNDTVLLYRDKITQFPGNIFAGIFGFKEEAFFEATADDRASVKVKF
ncbi:MAG: LemA family protein [Oscillospiraceae bacterium]|jgi:LemA protein|nr:LemA family protein [Oscillospiraceae bacterium]